MTISTPTEDTGRLRILDCGVLTFTSLGINNESYFAPFLSGAHYARHYWDTSGINPSQGTYDWSGIDADIATAKAQGRSYAWGGLMSVRGDEGSGPLGRLPTWLESLASNSGYLPNGYDVDWENATVLEWHDAFVAAAGTKYNGHPDIASVDIRSVGHWGEWTTGATPASMPSVARLASIVDTWIAAFPDTPKIGLVLSPDSAQNAAMEEYAAKGVAWRGDSYGHRDPANSSNHHQYTYAPAAVGTNMLDNWKNSPVIMEAGRYKGALADSFAGSIEGWLAEWPSMALVDVASVCSDIELWHVSSVHHQYANPAFAADKLSTISPTYDKLGYRLVINSVEYSDFVIGANSFTMEVNNKGLAPPYRDFMVMVKVGTTEVQSFASVKGMLPGVNSITVNFVLPVMSDGQYDLSIGLAVKDNNDRITRFANTAYSDGYNAIGDVSVFNVFSIQNVDTDNQIFDGQENVAINCIDAGAVEGLVKYGGIIQANVTWPAIASGESTITVPILDSGALPLDTYDMEVFKP